MTSTTRPAAAPLRLRTARLDIVAGTAVIGRAELTDRRLFAELLGARVPEAWPPPENDERTMTFFTEYVERHPEGVGWAAWYILLREDDDRRTAIGGCGFTGAPDDTGTVETGYSILEEYQRRGFAPEALSAILEWALTDPSVSRIVAHTAPDHRPSIRVLEKCGFTLVGPGTEPGTIRFERRASRRSACQEERPPAMAVSYMPAGAQTVTPYLAVPGVASLIDFLKATFDAKEIDRAVTPDGRIINATLAIGGSRLMMGDPGGQPAETAMLYVYVPDCDAVYARALAAGAKSLLVPTDQFYGDRTAAVQDATGNKWWIATRREDLTPEEGARRMAARFGG